MKFDAETIYALISQGVPGADVTLEDVRGDGGHFAVLVVSPVFAGLSLIQQRQMVYAALQGYSAVIAPNISLHTQVPQEARRTGTGARWS